MYCECGCGKLTAVARMTSSRYGHVKGQPIRFVNGHQGSLRKGPDHPNWKGGQFIDGRGYVQKKFANHPRQIGGYVSEHILIAEKALGKPLPPKAVVHHHNGKRSENHNSNLVICENNAYHLYLHKRLRAYEAVGNPNALRCTICKKYGLDVFPTKSGGGYHRPCENIYRRKLREGKTR